MALERLIAYLRTEVAFWQEASNKRYLLPEDRVYSTMRLEAMQRWLLSALRYRDGNKKEKQHSHKV